MKVLVTDGDERAALAAVRSLGRVAEVHVAAPGRASLASCSRFATAGHAVPDGRTDPVGLRNAVASLVRDHGLHAVLPVTDRTCVALLPSPEVLAPARLLAPAWPVYRRLSDKRAVADLAARHGLDLPRGVHAADVEAALDAARATGWPCVLKPVSSVDAGGGGAVRTVTDEPALRRAWSEEVGPGGALVQERVPGWGEGLFLLRAGGRTRAVFAHRRLREKPPGGGVSVLREAIAVDPDLRARVEAVVDETGLEGVAMAEFKTDGHRRWLMEFNVRLWGSLQLAIDAGVDFPRLMLAAFVGSDDAPGAEPVVRVGVRSRWLLGELDHALALARGRPDAHGRSGIGAAARVLLAPAGPQCRWEVLRRGDPRPFAYELRRWLRDLRTARGGPHPAGAPAVDPSP